MGTLSLVSGRDDSFDRRQAPSKLLGIPAYRPCFSRHHDLTDTGIAQRQEWQIVQSQFDLRDLLL